MSIRDSLLALKPKLRKVEIPDVGDCYIKEMSGSERDNYEAEQYQIKGRNVNVNRENARARLLVKCLVDENGTRVFKDDEATALGAIPASTLDKLFAVALKVNGFSEDDLDELTKN